MPARISPQVSRQNWAHPTGFLETIQASSRAPSGKVSPQSHSLLTLAELETITSYPPPPALRMFLAVSWEPLPVPIQGIPVLSRVER